MNRKIFYINDDHFAIQRKCVIVMRENMQPSESWILSPFIFFAPFIYFCFCFEDLDNIEL